MSSITDTIFHWSAAAPGRVAIRDASQELTYSQLADRVERFARALRFRGCRVVCLMANNSIDWVVADLGTMLAGVTCVPVPPWFTDSQLGHALESSAADTLITDGIAVTDAPSGGQLDSTVFGRLSVHPRALPVSTESHESRHAAKVTFTSGSTGQPRGVRLSSATLDRVATRLSQSIADVNVRRHLCVMPLATLLENMAGVYVPLMLGTIVELRSFAELGLRGSSAFDAERLLGTIQQCGAQSLILQPQHLRELSAAARQTSPPTSLRFVAVGGGRVSQADLDDATARGIPAFQGYGLSECASVVALNRPGAVRAGSVGLPLPGVGVSIARDGEILVSDQGMIGYLGDVGDGPDPVATGDLGELDEDGFLYVTGRRKNMFITSFGRNVSPEWPETELEHQADIAQACVFGEARPVNTAVVVPAPGRGTHECIAAAISAANRSLPDYAQVSEWIVAEEPFTPDNGLLTATGKPRREAIALRYVYADRHPRAFAERTSAGGSPLRIQEDDTCTFSTH